MNDKAREKLLSLSDPAGKLYIIADVNLLQSGKRQNLEKT